MSTLRRYIVAIVGLAVVFAAGIALGGGPLQGERSQRLASANSALTKQVTSLTAAQRIDAAVSEATTSEALGGRLADSRVTLVVMPGVSKDWVDSTREAVSDAGGQVNVTAHVTDRLLSPQQKSYAESVTVNSLKAVDDVEAGADAYETLGRLAGRAYATTSDDASVGDTVTQIDGQLAGAGLIKLDGSLQSRGAYVIVLIGNESGAGVQGDAHRTIAASFIDGLVPAAKGVLVAGPSTLHDSGGWVDSLSGDTREAVTTLAGFDSAAGPALAVLALEEVRAGTTGQAYGVVDNKAVLPGDLGD